MKLEIVATHHLTIPLPKRKGTSPTIIDITEDFEDDEVETKISQKPKSFDEEFNTTSNFDFETALEKVILKLVNFHLGFTVVVLEQPPKPS